MCACVREKYSFHKLSLFISAGQGKQSRIPDRNERQFFENKNKMIAVRTEVICSLFTNKLSLVNGEVRLKEACYLEKVPLLE